MFTTTAVGNALLLASLGCALVAAPLSSAAEGPAPPTKMRCEYLVNPLGIDVRQPRFAWVLGHTERGQKQAAYQIQVAPRLESLNQDKGE